jgi:hypothetical protein
MTEPDLTALVKRIQNILGCSKELAGVYAAGIGETPVIEHGKIIIRNEEGHIIMRVPASVLE